jgi:hypothetical protein
MMSASIHRALLILFVIGIAGVIVSTTAYGWDYYQLPLSERVLSDKYLELRPSGSIGIRLGMMGVALFGCLYMYPLRKQWKWLQKFGKTKNWLNFHVLCGVSAPLVITLHSSLKLQGLAGVAYWLMMAVMWSGFVGRYFYAQIPRSLNATTLTLQELEEMSTALRGEIEKRRLLSASELHRILSIPDRDTVRQMSLAGALFTMLWLDISRPFQFAGLRLELMTSTGEKFWTLGGMLPSSDTDLEGAIALVRRQSWLTAKIAFLDRAAQVFQLWHVVHRPFSYSFAVLAVIHITLVLLMGYF